MPGFTQSWVPSKATVTPYTLRSGFIQRFCESGSTLTLVTSPVNTLSGKASTVTRAFCPFRTFLM
ncbi:MAG: hypothetical protein BWX84_01661 [Verrucomicrobia bacterium ADurb.Bin118]|nr:MAG: hypothetical protein BWX84_01661 [Verrucomicrobia bacterium ADurb.Bin118]